MTQTQINVADIGEHVGLELATKMAKDFFDAYPEHANYFTIGKKIISQILEQPGCEGMMICPAIDETGNKTLVYAGVNSNGSPITVYPVVTSGGEVKMEEAIVADRVRVPDTGQTESTVPHWMDIFD